MADLLEEEVQFLLANGERVKCAPLLVSGEKVAGGGDTVVWEFEIPAGVKPKNLICILAEVRNG